MTDPRDIERINPDNQNVDTNVNSVPEPEDKTGGTSVLGAVVKDVSGQAEPEEEKEETARFPSKGEAGNKRAQSA